MSEVLLVNPRSFDIIPSYLPYGLLYLASFLRENKFSVKIYDSNTFDENFSEYLKNENPKIVGISILSGPCIEDAVKKAKLVRKLLPEAKIVFGGIHTTIFPKNVLKNEYVDFIVVNEGEHALVELAGYLLRKEGSPKEIKNLGYKKGGDLIINQIRPFINLDLLPLPAWDLVPIEKYLHGKFYSDRVITLHTSRGCPWNCSYCYNQIVNFRRWRGLSAPKIIEQIEYLMANYKIKGFQFYDDEFDVDIKRVVEFCNLLIKKKIKIKWAHFSRTNVADKERYALEKRAGCEFVEFGIESGSPRILKFIQKQQTVTDIKKAFRICKEVGLKAGAMFMIGIPTESIGEMGETIKLIKQLKAQQTICTIFHPYPGSQFFNYCTERGLIKLPQKIEDQGPYFDIGNSNINVSQIGASLLQKIHDKYAFNSILREIWLAIRMGNISLIFSHAKNHLNKNYLKYFFSGLKYIVLRE